MKKTIIISLFILPWISVMSQNWLPAGNGTNNGDNGGINLQTFNGKLIAGGAFYQAGAAAAYGVAMWDGTDWSIVDSSMNNFFSVRPFVLYHGQLYGFADPMAYLIRLDSNFKWHIVPNSNFYNQTYTGYISSAIVYNDELYVCGMFDSIGGTHANHIAKWNGSTWMPLDSGLNNQYVTGLKVYNNELYVGGAFTRAGGVTVHDLAKWNGSVWSDVGGGITGASYWAFRAMEVYNNELYIGGDLDSAGGQAMTRITKWDGTIFTSVGGGLAFGGFISALKVFGDRLFIGGNFHNMTGTWDGIAYDTLGIGLNALPSDFEIYNCQLYVGGYFHGTGYANGVAMLDTMDCSTSVHEIKVIDPSISIYPNPFSDQTTISFSEEQTNSTIKIIDVLGNVIKKINFTGKLCKIDKGGMRAGIYFVNITNNKGNITTKKIIIQ